MAYLLLNRDAVHRRARLAGLFWPDTGESNARNNLRHALWRLRKAIGHDYLLTDNISVTFDVNSDYWLDAAVLESTINDERPVDELIEAVAVYDGEFLPGFYDDWVVLERERLRAVFEEQSSRLLDRLVETRSWEAVLHWGEHWVALGQAPETAYRALMVAHAELGNQAGVAAVYQRCTDSLRQDLDLEPSQETQALHARLVSGERLFQISTNEAGRDRATRPEQRSGLPFHRVTRQTPPAFLDERIEPPELDQSVFVQRERELSRLDGFLEATLAGRGQVVFVTGSAGRGKTSLVNEFSRRAQATHTELLVVTGHCNAYAGAGDPYLPFRDVMGMLTGAVEAKWMAGAITRQHAQRLWHALPETVQALLDAGPDLIDIFVAGAALTARAAAANPDGVEWQVRLQELAAQRRSGRKDLEQSFLFEQYASVLHRLGARHPLLIVLDDLQWADIASISLLFHLGRRIGSSRILIVGAYRPDEVALGWDGDRHPLQKVLGEFKRTFGDHWVELAQAEGSEGRRFVDVLLDTKPNRLDEEFRQALYRQTAGHPLFTVELLQAMQARGDLIEDEDGCWVPGPAVDWQLLPARVEAVIEERVGRLDAVSHGILAVASVEGETFTPAVVARVLGLGQLQLLRHLSQELAKRHRLVREEEDISVGSRLLSRYRFSHILFQRYLRDDMDNGERRRLHIEIAQALENLYTGRTGEIAAQLLHHFREAGMHAKTIEYARLAARRAEAVYAYDEAIQHLQTALDLLEDGEQAENQLVLLEKLADLYALLLRRVQAISLYQAALEQWADLSATDEIRKIRLHRKILQSGIAMKGAHYRELDVLSPDLDRARSVLDASLSLPERDLPKLERVHVLTTLADDAAVALRLPLDLDAAQRYALAAMDLAEQLDAPVELSGALEALTHVYYARGMLPEQLATSRRRLKICRDPRFGDVGKRIATLAGTCRTLILAGEYAQAIDHLQEAESLAAQIGAFGWYLNVLMIQAQCLYRLDRWDEVLVVHETCRELEKRLASDQMRSICMVIALGAAVLALRGDVAQAKSLREEAYRIMVSGSGESPESWGRTQHY